MVCNVLSVCVAHVAYISWKLIVRMSSHAERYVQRYSFHDLSYYYKYHIILVYAAWCITCTTPLPTNLSCLMHLFTKVLWQHNAKLSISRIELHSRDLFNGAATYIILAPERVTFICYTHAFCASFSIEKLLPLAGFIEITYIHHIWMRERKQCKQKSVTQMKRTSLRSKCRHFWIPRAIVAPAHPLTRSTLNTRVYFSHLNSHAQAMLRTTTMMNCEMNASRVDKTRTRTLDRRTLWDATTLIITAGTDRRRRAAWYFTWATLKTVIT